MAIPFNKSYFGNSKFNNNSNNARGMSGNSWGNGWGMFNPFAQKDPYNPLYNGGLEGLTPEMIERIKRDFVDGDMETKAALWTNKTLQSYLKPLIGNNPDLINKIEGMSWTSQGTDLSKYGLNQMRFTDMMKAREAAKYGQPSAGSPPGSTNPSSGYNQPYIPVPAGGANPYGDYAALYRDQGGMIHDFGDNPAPTQPPPTGTGGGYGMPPWMGMNQHYGNYGMGRRRRTNNNGYNRPPPPTTLTPGGGESIVGRTYPGVDQPPPPPPPVTTTTTPNNTTDLGRDPNDPYISRN